MDRANRRFLVFSTSIAIPVALVIASLCGVASAQDQTENKTQLAVATTSSSTPGDEIQQVAGRTVIGKQLETGPTRGGLLRWFGRDNSPSTSSNQRQPSTRSTGTRSTGNSQPRGLMDTLFSDGNNSPAATTQPRTVTRSGTTRPSTSTAGGRSNGNSNSTSGAVNWDGIPYHSVATGKTPTAPTPIRDPGHATSRPSTNTTATRVIRGGTTTTNPSLSVPVPPRDAESVSSRSSTKTASKTSPTNGTVTNAVPTISASTASTRLSNVDSSRRSDRRDVDAFTAGQTASAPSQPARVQTPMDDVVDLVPRVSRRVIETPSQAIASAKEQPVAPEKTVAPAKVVKPEPKPETKPAIVAKAQPKPATDQPKAVAAQVPKSLPTPAPAPAPATASIAVPSVTLNPPTAYTKPVDPVTTPVPAPSATFSNQPYAASTPVDDRLPAEPVSHRAGPPAAAFTQSPTNDFQAGFGAVANAPTVTPIMSPSMSPTAIGSGLSGVRTSQNDRSFGSESRYGYPGELVETPGYHGSNQAASQGYGQGQGAGWGARQTNPPAYETAQVPTDPYGARATRPTMNTGNAFNASGAFNDRNGGPAIGAMPNRPAADTTGIPMHPIAGHGGSRSAMSNPAPSMGSPMGSPMGSSMGTSMGTLPRSATQAAPATQDNFAKMPSDPTNRMRSAGAVANGGVNRTGMVSSELPGIRVVTHGPDQVMIRQTNEYEIRVENRGAIDADGLIIRAMIPDWAEVQGQNATRGDVDTQAAEGTVERLIWKIDHLPAGTSEQLFVRLMAARSGTHNVDVDWTLMPQKTVATVHVHEPQLGLTIEGPDQVVYGQSQTYRVRVLNPGDGVAPNVVFTLSPESKTPQSQRIGDIPPGKEAQFDVELTAQDLGDLKIHGLAMGDLDLRAEAQKTIRVAAAQIEAMLNGPELKYQNTEALYNLQLQNVGTATTERVVATLRIPSGAKYLGGIEGAELRGNTLRWEIASLEPSATRDYQFRCNMAATGEQLFSFDCKGTAAGYADVALSTRVESIADLVLTINDPVAPAPIGSEVMYEIIVRNRGSREARDVKTLAQFSHGIEPQRIEGQSGEVVTGQVLFDPIPRIGAGEEIRLRVVAIADRAGHHRFRTEVRSGDTVLVAEEATHYMSPQADRVSRRSSDGKQMR